MTLSAHALIAVARGSASLVEHTVHDIHALFVLVIVIRHDPRRQTSIRHDFTARMSCTASYTTLERRSSFAMLVVKRRATSRFSSLKRRLFKGVPLALLCRRPPSFAERHPVLIHSRQASTALCASHPGKYIVSHPRSRVALRCAHLCTCH